MALHHAAQEKSNEGIKFSALATAIEQDSQNGDKNARQLMTLFRGADELMGFFGSLGRTVSGNGGMERVVSAYSGEDQDVDIGFWNIEWFNRRWEEKLDSVARIVVEMNLDIWVFVESSQEATDALARHLAEKYNVLTWRVFASQDAAPELQITTVMWNSATVEVSQLAWPEKVHRWFNVSSRDFGSLGLEAVHGKVFDRFPALFQVNTRLAGAASRFNLVPIHLKAKDEGSCAAAWRRGCWLRL
ncbi:hypothetical protein [Mesorhizobium sp. M0491]|uniref:hypothetical protein n=1 Tax=Mesorhizobium sp. M0491 TaxID=2956950 RepID=UPI00333679C1